MHEPYVARPVKRGKWRKKAGRMYFIFKRKWHWALHHNRYTNVFSATPLPHAVFKHQSLILRPLKDVDMQLQRNKKKNLELAVSKLNGVMITPGKTLSLWKHIGKPTRKKGYLEGLVLDNGHITSGTGGGLCQLGNLVYWICIHSALEIKERYRHSYDVFPDVNRKVPFGAGATLAYNYVDLQVYNPTEQVYQLNVWLDEEYLHGELRCSAPAAYTIEIKETDHRIVPQYWGGHTRHNKIWKQKIKQGEIVEEELLAENHAIMMYNPLLPA